MATTRKNAIAYIVAYIIPLLTGILIYLTVGQKDPALKFHAVQAMILGVIIWVLSLIPIFGWIIALLGWLYGLYVGIQGANGSDMEIPFIGKFAKDYSK